MKSKLGIATFAAVSGPLCASLFVVGCAHSPSVATQDNDGFDLDEKDTVAPRACTPATSELAAGDGHIATFARVGDATDFQGRILTYPVGAPTAPKATTQDGDLHVTAHVPVTEKAQYVGVVMGFPKCIDASRFTGVRFSMRGSYKGCTMQYAANDVAHQDRYTLAPYATGGRGSYPPQARFEREQISSAAKEMRIPFTEATIRGNPPVSLDTSKVTAVLWQLTVSPAAVIDDGTTACDADLTIDDVNFY